MNAMNRIERQKSNSSQQIAYKNRSGETLSNLHETSQCAIRKTDSNDTGVKILMKSVQDPSTNFDKEIRRKLKQKESGIKPMNIDSSALMFSIKDKHGFNAKDRKRMVDKEKEAQNKIKRKSFVNQIRSSDSVSSDIVNPKSGNLKSQLEVSHIKHKNSAVHLNNYTEIDISE